MKKIKNKKTRIFIAIPIILLVCFISIIYFFKESETKYQGSLCYSWSDYIENGISHLKNWKYEMVWNCIGWIPDWKRISYYKNWNIIARINYINWTPDWKRFIFYKNWNIKYEEFFKNWILDWEWVEYYKNWWIKEGWNYIDWYKVWIRTWYYKNWNISYEIEYLSWNFQKKTFYKKNGSIKSVEEY